MDRIPLFRVTMDPEVGPLVSAVLQSGYVGQGPKVEEFEDELAPWVGRRPVTTLSGTAALTIALRLAGVTSGSYVVTTPMTCSATNIAILSLGAHPVWADVDPRTGLIDPQSVGERLWEQSKLGHQVGAVVAVDWGGQPCDYDELGAVASLYGARVVADAAHSFGATYKDRPVGTLAWATMFSFQAIKTLNSGGDGGALVVLPEFTKRAKDMRWFGLDREAPVEFRGELDITEWGFKAHMNDIAATIGLANLGHVERTLAAQRGHARLYDEKLADEFTRTAPAYDHSGAWWMYTTLLPSGETRPDFQRYMLDRGVTVSQVHWRNDPLTVMRPYRRKDLPGLDEFAGRMICLPTHSATPAQRVAAIANSFFGHGDE